MTRRRRGAGSSSGCSRCIFCGAEPPLSDEHIFGDWLRDLGYTGEGVREIIPGDGRQPIIQRGGMFSKKLKIVCGSCNNEWMSQLEEAAKPLLVQMYNLPYLPYQQPQIVLNTSDQLALARWAFKTVAVALYADRISKFPAAHREEFYRTNDPPQHVQIWIGAASVPNTPIHGEHLAETQYRPRQLTIRQGESTIVQTAYESHVRLFNMVFVVMGYIADADTDITARISPGDDLNQMLTPLWPANQGDIAWPPPVNVDTIGGMSALAQLPVISGGLTGFEPATT